MNEALEFLKKDRELKPLHWNKYAYKAAKKHGLDVIKNGVLKHKGSDGTSAKDRIEKYGHPFYGGAESIVIGLENPWEVALQLIINNGVKSRGDRENFTDPAHRCGAVSYCKHKVKGSVYIFTYAFYVSSLEKGNQMMKFLDKWRDDTEFEAKQQGWNGKGCISAKIIFEYPNLVKTIELPDKEIQLAKDVNKMIYKD